MKKKEKEKPVQVVYSPTVQLALQVADDLVYIKTVARLYLQKARRV